jgi:cyclopropane fatty-acyl-phospholipid synthase-like methyltransferase
MILAVSILSVAMALAAPDAQSPSRAPDTIYLPTPPEVVTAMLDMAGVSRGDVVYDLGAGDGRIVIAAVKQFGAARGVGVELDPVRVQEARALARQAGVGDRVEFRQEDVMETDFHDATVVTLYLGTAMNAKLRPRLTTELKPGSRVVSHAFEIGDWPADQTRMVSGRPIFLWLIR